MEIVTADIGGTHARFALARVKGGRVVSLGEAMTFATARYPGIQEAWSGFIATLADPAPRKAAIAVAAPMGGEELRFTNSPWVVHPRLLAAQLGLEDVMLINDFDAVGHAVAHLGPECFRHVSGPDQPLPDSGVISVVGPGTGLGVAQLTRFRGGYFVIGTEGGHIGFAPSDEVEDAMLQRLRKTIGRVSVERFASGSAIINIYEGIAAIEGRTVHVADGKSLWASALDGGDPLAVAALDRFLLILGAVSGDLALAQGAHAVVIAGGLGQRLCDHFSRSGFAARFVAKGRHARRMEEIPVRLITHPEPGLYGAAAAFARKLESGL